MPCHVGDLACLRDLLDGVPTGLRIAEALLSDRLALALLAGCVLALACLIVMVGKICSLLYDDINGDEEWRQPPARQSSSRILQIIKVPHHCHITSYGTNIT